MDFITEESGQPITFKEWGVINEQIADYIVDTMWAPRNRQKMRKFKSFLKSHELHEFKTIGDQVINYN